MDSKKSYVPAEKENPYSDESISKTGKGASYLQGKKESLATALVTAYIDGIEAGARIASMD